MVSFCSSSSRRILSGSFDNVVFQPKVSQGVQQHRISPGQLGGDLQQVLRRWGEPSASVVRARLLLGLSAVTHHLKQPFLRVRRQRRERHARLGTIKVIVLLGCPVVEVETTSLVSTAIVSPVHAQHRDLWQPTVFLGVLQSFQKVLRTTSARA